MYMYMYVYMMYTYMYDHMHRALHRSKEKGRKEERKRGEEIKKKTEDRRTQHSWAGQIFKVYARAKASLPVTGEERSLFMNRCTCTCTSHTIRSLSTNGQAPDDKIAWSGCGQRWVWHGQWLMWPRIKWGLGEN